MAGYGMAAAWQAMERCASGMDGKVIKAAGAYGGVVRSEWRMAELCGAKFTGGVGRGYCGAFKCIIAAGQRAYGNLCLKVSSSSSRAILPPAHGWIVG